MDVEKIFHMKEGLGDASYARNSSLQKKGLDTVKHMTIDTIIDLYLTKTPHSMAIADLGCSSGPNTLSIIGELVGAVDEACRKTSQPTPEFRVFLNDLPTNDFNSIFIALPDLYTNLNRQRSRDSCSVFIAGVPGSFYGRLFPSNTLHFIHSSYSLHWLSKVPPGLFDQEGKPINKGKMYISKTSPALVSKAYSMQFQEDFLWFLRSRSEEIVSGGRMVLILLGRRSSDHTERGNVFFWDMLAKTFATMVSQVDICVRYSSLHSIHDQSRPFGSQLSISS